MQEKKTSNLEKSQSDKNIKSIKVLHSNSHVDRPKISMEGKWLEQLGFHIGDKLQVKYGDRFIFISHAMDGEEYPLAVHEPADVYLAGKENSCDMGQACDSRKQEEVKIKQIKVASSMHVRQTAWYGGSLYYPERPKISMEGKWLEKAGFFVGKQLQVEYQVNAIRIYPAA